MPLPYWLLHLGVIAGLFLLQPDPQTRQEREAQCEQERRAFAVPYAARNEGQDIRNHLLTLVRPIIERHEGKAPVCVGRLRVHEAYLLMFNGRYRELIEGIDGFMERYGSEIRPESYILLRHNTAYARMRIGETVAGAQDYFAAATVADRAQASSGVKALVEAAATARKLGDLDASQSYLTEAKQIIRDSLSADSTLKLDFGFTMVSQSLLTDRRLTLTADSAARAQLIAALEESTQQAIQSFTTEEGTGAEPRRLTIKGKEAGLLSLAQSLYGLAAAYAGRHAEAARRVEPALEAAREAGVFLPSAPADAWLVRSRVAQLRGDLLEAREAALEARREARAIPDEEVEVEALERLGLIAEQGKAWDEAARWYRDAIGLREAVRERMRLQDWSALIFATAQTPYRGLVRTQLATGNVSGAFQTLDQTRARYLQDLRAHNEVRSRLSPSERRQADSLVDELEAARLRLLHEDLRASARASLTESTSRLQEDLETLTGLRTEADESLDLDQLQETLGEREQTLISYFLDDQASHVFVVRPDTLVAIPLELTPAEVRDGLRRIGAPWQNQGTVDAAFALEPLHQLYKRVVAPVEPWLAERGAIVIIPDNTLAALPFAMLTTERAESFEHAPYLLRTHSITTELAASLILDTEDTSTPPLDLAAYGRSEFSEAPSPLDGSPSFADLPYVGRELSRIASHVGKSQVRVGEEATETHFKQALTTAKIVHVASHAEAHPTLPLYSRILLYDGLGGDEDGVLHLYEIQDRALPADLVVLSGCSTARGANREGEGIVGLQYAVRAAGARASLATLWPVDDQSIVELMDTFYEGLEQGLSKDRALQNAQLAYLDEHEGLKASPFYWAAPTLSGDPSPIPLRARRNLWGPLALAVALLGVGLAWWLRTRPDHASSD